MYNPIGLNLAVFVLLVGIKCSAAQVPVSTDTQFSASDGMSTTDFSQSNFQNSENTTPVNLGNSETLASTDSKSVQQENAVSSVNAGMEQSTILSTESTLASELGSTQHSVIERHSTTERLKMQNNENSTKAQIKTDSTPATESTSTLGTELSGNYLKSVPAQSTTEQSKLGLGTESSITLSSNLDTKSNKMQPISTSTKSSELSTTSEVSTDKSMATHSTDSMFRPIAEKLTASTSEESTQTQSNMQTGKLSQENDLTTENNTPAIQTTQETDSSTQTSMMVSLNKADINGRFTTHKLPKTSSVSNESATKPTSVRSTHGSNQESTGNPELSMNTKLAESTITSDSEALQVAGLVNTYAALVFEIEKTKSTPTQTSSTTKTTAVTMVDVKTDHKAQEVQLASSQDFHEHFYPEHPALGRDRYCTGARHCSSLLNERCITKDRFTVCGCGRAFYRNPFTKVCEKKMAVLPSIHLPNQQFIQELQDQSSAEYETFKEEAEDMMQHVFRVSRWLRNDVVDVMVTGFSKGSLVINMKLIVTSSMLEDDDNDNITAVLINEIDAALSTWIPSQQSFFNLEGARVKTLKIETNPCSDEALNYCSRHAFCRSSKLSFTFTCRCKLGFIDESPDKETFPGEICLSSCSPKYCKNNGTCYNDGSGIKCLCQDWYVGKRCQYSAKEIIIVVGVVVAILISVVLVAWCKYWKKVKRHPGNTVRKMIIVEPRIGKKTQEKSRLLNQLECEFSVSPSLPQVHEKKLDFPSKILGSTEKEDTMSHKFCGTPV